METSLSLRLLTEINEITINLDTNFLFRCNFTCFIVDMHDFGASTLVESLKIP